MSILSEIIAGGASGVLSSIGTLAKDLREAITGKKTVDPVVMAELALRAEALEVGAEKAKMDYEQAIITAQTSINALEAQNKSIFVSGWRPAVGWVCVSGMFYTFLLKPVLPWLVSAVCQISGAKFVLAPLPEVPMGDLIVLLGGMLGLGSLRSYEKVKGVK